MADIVEADAMDMWIGAYLEFRLSDETRILAPLVEFAAHNGFGGHYSQAAAADGALIGRLGKGRDLEIPIMIPGGTIFRADVHQLTALSVATTNVKIGLYGTLTRP